jgi:hypothetical protein
LSVACTANARDMDNLVLKHEAAIQNLMQRHADAVKEQEQAYERSVKELESLAGNNKELREKLADQAASSEAECAAHETKVAALLKQVGSTFIYRTGIFHMLA